MASKNLQLQLIFKTDAGSNQTIVIKNVKENLDPNKILAFTQKVIANKYFVPSSGTALTDIDEINLITTTKEALL